MSRYLTKSRFKLAVECPTKLFYTQKENEYKNIKSEDSFLEALAHGGFQVGEFAKLLHPNGIEVSAKNNQEAELETQRLLAENDEITLFEPAIRFKNLFIRIDILIKRKNTFELIEVKAKSVDPSNPEIEGQRTPLKAEFLPYLQDVAFQKYVLSKAFPQSTITSYLLLTDKTSVVSVDGLNQFFKIQKSGKYTKAIVHPEAYSQIKGNEGILALLNTDKYVDIIINGGIDFPGGHGSLEKLAQEWSTHYANDHKIPPTLHSGCAHCEFRSDATSELKSGFHDCLKEVTGLSEQQIDDGTVLDIWNYRSKDNLLSQGIYKLNQVREEDINIRDDQDGLSNSQRQWIQCNGIPPEMDMGGFYLDKDFLRNQFDQWKYPFHMIDFETSTTAIPFFKGMRPYESVAFQFSHHILYKDGSVEHADQFLMAEPKEFPNYEFLRALKNSLNNTHGTVFRWADHEKTILNHIRKQLIERDDSPSDKEDLLNFIAWLIDDEKKMVDLNKLTLRAYFHPETKGRTSIKKTLPAILKTSKFLEDKYSKPIYGTSLIKSHNFTEMIWWKKENNEVLDPYNLLTQTTTEMLGDDTPDFLSREELEINNGGAALAAFSRLQFEDLAHSDRDKIKDALLRYCELDTFAMVMIIEAWRGLTH
jgi:hypothetical protein